MAIGLFFALCARVQFIAGIHPWGRELAAVLSFEAIIAWPVLLYFELVHADWSWMYFVDPHRLPTGTGGLVLLAQLALVLSGYLIGFALLRARREPVLYGGLAAAGLVVVALSIAGHSRLFAAGTFADYRAGRCVGLAESKLGWALVTCTLGGLAALALVGLFLWGEGRRFRARLV